MKKQGTKEQRYHFESFIRVVSRLSDDLIVPRAPACEPTSESITCAARWESVEQERRHQSTVAAASLVNVISL